MCFPKWYSEVGATSVCVSFYFQKQLAVIFGNMMSTGREWALVVYTAQVPANIALIPYALAALLPKALQCPISPSFVSAITTRLGLS